MRPRFPLLLLLALVLLLTTGLAQAQQVFQFTSHDIKLEILPPEVFQAQFGKNPDVPRTDQAILALAEQLYGKKEQPQAAKGEECREYEVGLLFAALQNPAVTDYTRRQVDYIIAAVLPTAPWKYYTSGHFKFWYVDNDPDTNHNVTLTEVQSTASSMNYGWTKYVNAGFKEPKNYLAGGVKMVDVKVYYLDYAQAGLLGQTSSAWNHIELNSKNAVKNACKRKTTSNHELFHRVQYASGYVTGTANLKWIVEGSAAWSQKFTYAYIRDYMDRMNSGLQVPDKNMFVNRSYDNCHFWVYMDELFSPPEYGTALKNVWNTYSTNGKNAQAAVASVVSAVGIPSFDNYVIKWTRANYCKDFANTSTWKHDYTEDETTTTQCSVTHGPLSHVPKVAAGAISSNSTVITKTGTVSPYSADYYEFTVGPAVTTIKIYCDGADTGDFAWQFIPIQAGAVKTYAYSPGAREYTHTRSFTAGTYDKYGVIVVGRSKGGSYTLRVGP
jgi:hypothetical protein